MKTYQIACTTRAGNYIETQASATSMTGAIESFIYDLAINHLTLMDDVVELDLTECN
jgi:isoaspartyl peptidase/L-asparaginase-like protein (Ntn-hydrolase superfamily)